MLVKGVSNMFKQTFFINCAAKNASICWCFTNHTTATIRIKLYDSRNIYEEFRTPDNAGKQIPGISGASLCSVDALMADIETDSAFCLTPSVDTDMEAGCGHTFTLTGSSPNNSDSFFSLSVISSGMNNTAEISPGIIIPPEIEFISQLYYHYLSWKDNYTINYLSDPTVKYLCGEFDKVYVPEFDYKGWYDKMLAKGRFDRRQLTLTTLMKYDEHYTGSGLRYFCTREEPFMLMAFGKKVWSENKITYASCPFQNIRVIHTNVAEHPIAAEALINLADIELFSGNSLNVAASHATEDSMLSLEVTRGLNYGNLGIKVFSKNTAAQEKMIKESIAYAVQEEAQILIFPELSINEDQLTFLENTLNRLAKSSSLKLVVAGSYYKKCNARESHSPYTNTSEIYVNTRSYWRKLTSYNKMIPFSTPYTKYTANTYNISQKDFPTDKYKLLVEDIELGQNITLLPFKDCIVGIAICRDAMDILDKHNPIHKYCDFVDIMLIISDNSGDSNMFVGVAECLARWHNCATVYTNSISEANRMDENGGKKTDSFLEVSFGLYPDKECSSSTSVNGEITYIKNPFTLIENTDCTGEADSACDMILNFGILNTKKSLYKEITEDDLKHCCKVYQLIAPSKPRT